MKLVTLLGLLYLFVGDTAKSIDHISIASSIYETHLGKDHPSTKDVQEVLLQLQQVGEQ